MSKYFKQRVQESLNDKSARVGRYRAFGVIRPGMKKMVSKYPTLRDSLRAVKEEAIGNLPNLLEQAKQSLEANGAKVYIANSSQEAVEYIGNIVKSGLVVKSKSNAGKEINITNYLEGLGAKVVETDLGDRINQLAGGVASHSLAPAIHVPIEEVTELFSKEVGTKLEADENILVEAARKTLRSYLEDADVGISGANAVVAETGTVFLTENEGNIRAVTSMPKVHIAIAGIEKIVSKLNDGLTVVKAAATYGVGQDIGTYVSTISGPSRYTDDDLDFLGSGQGPEEVHVVFLKEGREKAIEEGFEEALYCINCGSCLNFCPVYGEIGGTFGYKYLGGRGTVFTAFHGNLEKAEEAGLFACIGCEKCLESCAVGMNTPDMISRLRQKVVDKKGIGSTKKFVFNILAKNKLPKYLKIARTFQDFAIKRSEDKKSATARVGLESMGLPKDRLIPTVSENNFAEIVDKRKANIDKPKMTVSFFAGCMVNYSKPELGVDLLDVLEAESVKVLTYEEESCCGLPSLTSGSKEHAKQQALNNINVFSRDDFDYLLFVCPSCATTVKKEWADLIKNENLDIKEKYQKLSAKVMDINEFLVEVLKLSIPGQGIQGKATYHDPCHLVRGLDVREQPRELITSIKGLDFIEMEEADSCCGFGGSFSIFHYDISKAINNEKINKINDTDADYLVTSCPGCMTHIADGIHRTGSKQRVVHTIELIADAYRGGKR